MPLWIWPSEWYLDIGVLLLAVVLDLTLPEPPNALHPVVWMGKVISFLERLSPESGSMGQFLFGLGIALFVPIVFGSIAFGIVIWLRMLNPIAYLIGGAVIFKTTFAVRGLSRAAWATSRALETQDMDEARQSIRSLVSRDAATLTAPLIAAAAIESVAENSTDSFIGPWLAFALLGVPGAAVYRAVNTLDSMLGYHGRYEYLGKASARLDDIVSFVPARIAALLTLMGGLSARLPVRQGWTVMRRDHGLTESPNAGWTMSAISGLLGVALEKPGHYRLGDGLRDPEFADVGRAIRVLYLVAALGIALASGLLIARLILLGIGN